MLCYYYPPIQAVGAHRSVAFAQGLAERGWRVTVLSVAHAKDRWVKLGAKVPAQVPVVRAPELNLGGACDVAHAVIRRCASVVGTEVTHNYPREVVCFPDPQVAWLALPAARELLASHDMVYVSCSPFSSAVQGALAAVRLNKPLFVDLRDPWAVIRRPGESALRLRLLSRVERWVISRAERVIVNTEGALKLYREAYPEISERFVVVPNGYDTLPDTPPPPAHGPFRIVHAGSFYGGRTPVALLKALAQIRAQNKGEVEFIQVGESTPELDGRVHVTGTVSREEALRWIGSASLLYLKQNPEYPTAVAAKTHEYLASGRPILVDAPAGDNVELIKRFATRSYIVSSGSVPNLCSALERALRERTLSAERNEEYLTRYRRSTLINRFEQVLRGEDIPAEYT